MISILIPIYNYDVSPLVGVLQRQCLCLNHPFEILCFDDASLDTYKQKNRALIGMEGVLYRELSENKGRSGIRNFLASAARFPFLLFLDNDGMPESSDFMELYLQQANPNRVLYGGRTYDPQPPSDKLEMLHWKYGSRREVLPAVERQKSPYRGFQTNNFLISRKLFLDIGFDESMVGYGHEDTLFGQELERRGIPICHLTNPYRHLGLEPVDVFLKKQEQALQNLFRLEKKGISMQTRLSQVSKKISKTGLEKLFFASWIVLVPLLLLNLKSKYPSLFVLDIYRLGFFISLKRK